MAAGKFTVTVDRMTGERVDGRDVRALVRLGARDRASTNPGARVARPLTLGDLVETVRRAAGGGR